MSTEIVVAREPQTPSIFALPPAAMVQRATEIANVLRDVILKQKLAVRIGPNEYVKSEGWSTMGVMLGILPREREVREHENGDFEAWVDLIRQSDGVVVGGASSLCSVDEKRWKTADRYARRSMAITRATGKAYRLCFSWIMTLSGYSPTPYEEMPHEEAPKRDRGSLFDKDNIEHIAKIEKWLEARKEIPKENYQTIVDRLHGRPTGDVSMIVDQMGAF
jgi:hypothetical protein